MLSVTSFHRKNKGQNVQSVTLRDKMFSVKILCIYWITTEGLYPCAGVGNGEGGGG